MKFTTRFFLAARSLGIALSLLFISSPAFAKEKNSGWKLPGKADLLQIIPAPPTAGSAAEKADLDGVLAMQFNPSPEALAHAEQSVGFTVFSFSDVLGADFNAEFYPKTAEFFDRIEATVNPPKNFLKETYQRIRPYRAFPDQVKTLVTKEEGYSYPSGHSTRAWLFALVLGALDGGNRNAYLASAMQICQDRVIGGMHYPSDVLESRVLAEEIYRDLLSNKDFMSELEKVHQTEWIPKNNSNGVGQKPSVKTP